MDFELVHDVGCANYRQLEIVVSGGFDYLVVLFPDFKRKTLGFRENQTTPEHVSIEVCYSHQNSDVFHFLELLEVKDSPCSVVPKGEAHHTVSVKIWRRFLKRNYKLVNIFEFVHNDLLAVFKEQVSIVLFQLFDFQPQNP